MQFIIPGLMMLLPLLGAAEASRVIASAATTPSAVSMAPGRHKRIMESNRRLHPDLIVIGDSITHQFGGVPTAIPDGLQDMGASTWARYYAPRRAVNFGVNRDKTGNIIWRLQNGELDGISPKAAILMAGLNNAPINP